MVLSNRSSFVLASNNPGKVQEVMHKFNEAGLDLISPADLGFCISPDEVGRTFLENSRIKAYETFKLLRGNNHKSLGVIADDSGLEIDALGGMPGVDSALYLGKDVTYDVRNAYIIKQMEGVTSRTARFVCVLTCILPNGEEKTVRGTVTGEVSHAPKGFYGFGYDPIFFLPEYGKTMAELPLEEKNKISHRSRALTLLFDVLRGLDEDIIS